MNEWYDREGNPISMERWGELFEDKSYQVLRQTQVGRYWVSTVWLGMNHGFGLGVPLIFESMIRDEESGQFLDEQYRYATEQEALAHHEQLVEQARLLGGINV